MSIYFLISLIIISVPFFLSFENRVRYVSKWQRVGISMLLVGTPFILWNIFASTSGHWDWNPNYIYGLRFLYLPIEEWMFFVTTPFSSIFVFEVLNYYLKDKFVVLNRFYIAVISITLILFGLFNYSRGYTFIVFISAGLFTLIFISKKIMNLISKNIIYYLITGFGTFFIFNSILTVLPILIYNPNNILGIRIGSVPVEDFIYNYILLGGYIIVYKFINIKIG